MDTIPKGRYPVTIAGAAKLHEELDALETKRSEVSANIRTAKGFGDLSENFEYHEAKREGGMVQGRIQQLKIIIPDLLIVNRALAALDANAQDAIVTRVLDFARAEDGPGFATFWVLSNPGSGQWFDRVLTFENGRLAKSEERARPAQDERPLVLAG